MGSQRAGEFSWKKQRGVKGAIGMESVLLGVDEIW